MDLEFLRALTEAPSVGTACQPVVQLLTDYLGAGYSRTLVQDGFCLFQKGQARPEDLRVVFVAHMDEVGGCVYGARTGGGYDTRVWGNQPSIFAEATLQAYDYLAADSALAFRVRAEVTSVDGEDRLVLFGDGIRPYRTVWTFDEQTTIYDDVIEGKALDPRVTLFAALQALKDTDNSEVGLMCVMAEECAMDVARKGVAFLQRNSPDLRLIANADVPSISNLGDGRLDLPAIRIFEGRNFIDPTFGIAVSDRLSSEGVELHLSAARSGSQTLLFTPLAPTLSIALPATAVHLPRYQMSITGLRRCSALLGAIADGALHGAF